MEGISDIRIVGIDEKRPPRIRKEPYIDLIFCLSHKAPVDWCRDLIELQSGQEYATEIDATECLYLETWVRTPGEIVNHFQQLKQSVTDCNALYIRKIEAQSRVFDSSNEKLQKDAGPQGDLNRIIANLDFSE